MVMLWMILEEIAVASVGIIVVIVGAVMLPTALLGSFLFYIFNREDAREHHHLVRQPASRINHRADRRQA